MAQNVTLTLAPDVLDGARALAAAEGVPLSTWLAAKVRREVRAQRTRAYVAWAAAAGDAEESAAFDRAAADTVAESWSGSEW